MPTEGLIRFSSANRLLEFLGYVLLLYEVSSFKLGSYRCQPSNRAGDIARGLERVSDDQVKPLIAVLLLPQTFLLLIYVEMASLYIPIEAHRRE
jgi:hypothetical protein